MANVKRLFSLQLLSFRISQIAHLLLLIVCLRNDLRCVAFTASTQVCTHADSNVNVHSKRKKMAYTRILIFFSLFVTGSVVRPLSRLRAEDRHLHAYTNLNEELEDRKLTRKLTTITYLLFFPDRPMIHFYI